MATKHHVLRPGLLSDEQLGALEAGYERDLAENAKAADAAKAADSGKPKLPAAVSAKTDQAE